MAAQRDSILADRYGDVKPPMPDEGAVNCPTMKGNVRGETTRARILAELRRRRDAWEPELSVRQLASLIGIDLTATRYHLKVLRAAGLVHPEGVAITEAGHETGNWGLTP